jgi:hypothetical protein
MKILLRSCFLYDKGDDGELFLRNFLHLDESGLGFETPADNVLWDYILRFVRRHNHIPGYATLVQNFKLKGQDEILDRLEAISKLKPLTQGDFDSRLDAKAHDRRVRRVSELLKDASLVLSSGLEVDDPERKGEKKVLHGPVDAVRYMLDRSHDIVAPTLGANLSGEATTDGEGATEEYERVEADPKAGIGQFTGLPQADNVIAGAKRKELWIHAAYTGGLKSTLMLNWAYNQSVYFRFDSLIFSLEMPYEQCRRILYAIHSAHEKFKAIRYKLGLQKSPDDTVGLPYEYIQTGTLHEWHPNARQFYFDYVIPDFNDAANKYGKIHIEVANPDKADFTVADLRQRAEVIYADRPFSLLFVDHVGLMSPRKWVSSTTERLNEVLRDLKRLSMSFNRGMGMAVVGLFQIGREGFKRVLKARQAGRRNEYNPTDLSYANEAERSADNITATWVDDELVEQNRVECQHLKRRDGKRFQTFLARVEWPCRRIIPCYDPLPLSGGQQAGTDKTKQAAIEAAVDSINE